MTFVEFLVAVLVGWLLSGVSTWLVLLRVMRWLDRRMLPPVPHGGAKAVPVKQVHAPGLPVKDVALSSEASTQPPALVEEQDTEAFHKV